MTPLARLIMQLTIEWGTVFGAAALIMWLGTFWVAALTVLIVCNFSIQWNSWVRRNWP